MAEGVDYTIGVKAIMDATSVKTETTSAEAAVEALEQAVESSADAMDTALDSVDASGVSDTMDTAVTDVDAGGSKMSSIGSEVGAEFSENLSEGFQSGDFVGVALETFASLTPAIGAAGIGFGVAALLANQFIQQSAEERAAMVEAVNKGFQALEVKAGQTGRQIAENILEGITFKDVLAQLGGEEGELGGFEKIVSVSDDLEVSQGAILELLRTGITPQTELTYSLLVDQLTAMEDLRKEQGGFTDEQGETYETLKDIYAQSQLQTDNLARQKDLALLERDALAGVKDEQYKITASAADHADAMERTADAADRWAAAIQRAISAAASAQADALKGLSF